jgi:tetratricopeptide (TPR) repeat protein
MMFSTFSKLSRSLSSLLVGCVLAVAAQLAGAQTLADIHGLMKKGDLPRALNEVERYIASQPRDAQGPFTKGLILSEMGRSQEAIAVFTGLTENFPELPEPYNNLAVLYAQQQQFDKARAALEMAIHTHPSYSIAHENLGDVYAKLASQAYGKALQLGSLNKATQTKLSMVRELISVPGRYDEKRAMASAGRNVPVPMNVAPVEVLPAPAPMPAPVAKPGAGETRGATVDEVKSEIAEIVRDWAKTWSSKDVEAYLSFYAGNFQTPRGMTRREWEAERWQRIDKPGRLRVVVDNIRVSVSGDRATARFRQRYTSATLRTQTNKTLVFVESENGWLILQERVN